MANDNPRDDLRSRLAAVLPKDVPFHVYHISTPPAKCDPLCSPPPGQRPDRTYCEKHFLAVSIDGDTQGKQIFVLGIEIFIFTTAKATTIFVSKADSTGYLHLLPLPAGAPSPIREVCAAFIAFLVDKRRRNGVKLVVSLFARAQSQYLFPGSSSNGGKHILDDRGLVKWWCRVLDPLLRNTVRGYLVVPGLDAYETRAFTPRGASSSGRWTADHPLERISHYTREFDWVPPRCLIPRYPDDPKSRFRDELDEEAAKTAHFKATGGWKSVRTLETFWDMMAFRQECSSGRLTGFVWIVFDDDGDDTMEGKHVSLDAGNSSTDQPQEPPETPRAKRTIPNTAPTGTPRKLFPTAADTKRENSMQQRKPKAKKKKKLRGIIIPRQPRIKTAQRNYLLDRPSHTAYYSWDPSGRGERIISERDYKRVSELLLHLDFASTEKGVNSTRRWVSEVALGSAWGYDVRGEREIAAEATAQKQPDEGAARVNNLTGLVKRKRADTTTAPPAAEANVLGAGLVRKKPKA